MAVRRFARNSGSSRLIAEPRVDQDGARLISPPSSSQSIDGSSSHKPNCRVAKSRPARTGLRANGKNASTPRSESPSPTITRRQCAKDERIIEAATSPVLSDRWRSPQSQDAHEPEGGIGASKRPPVTREEKILILKLCYENRRMLFDCPPAAVGGDEEFWGLILEMIKSRVRRDLPSAWSKWSGLKEHVNLKICRKRPEKAKGRDVLHRRKELPSVHELGGLIAKWQRILKFREVQISESRFSNALEDLLGRDRLDDLIGAGVGELRSPVASPNASFYLPGISEAIHHRRRQLEDTLHDSSSDSEDLDKGGDQPHISNPNSSGDASQKPVDPCAVRSMETSPSSDEEQEHPEDIIETLWQSQESHMGSKASKDDIRTIRNVSEAGSAILGSTPFRNVERREASTRHRGTSTCQRSSSLYPLKPCSDIVGNPTRSPSVDDDELPELTSLFSARRSSLERSSSSIESTSKLGTTSGIPPREKMPSPKRSQSKKKETGKGVATGRDEQQSNGPRICEPAVSCDSFNSDGTAGTSPGTTALNHPAETERSLSRGLRARRTNGSEMMHSTGPIQGRNVSRTPALVVKENARYALKHSKPSAPVRVPHRSSPPRQLSPSRSKLSSNTEISTKTFYASKLGKPLENHTSHPTTKAGGGGFVMPPRIDTPFSTPGKGFVDRETPRSVAASIPIHQTASGCSTAISSSAKGGKVPNKQGEYVIPNGEAWYNLDIPLPDQREKTKSTDEGLTGLLEDGIDSSEQSPVREMADVPTPPAESHGDRSDSPSKSASTGRSQTLRDLEKTAPNLVINPPPKIEPPKSKKPRSRKRKRRQQSSPAKGNPAYTPFALKEAVESPTAGSTKKQKQPLRCESQEASAVSKLGEGTQSNWDSEMTPSPPPKAQRKVMAPSTKSLNRRQSKGLGLFGRGDGSRSHKPKGKGGTPGNWANQQSNQAHGSNHARHKSKPSSHCPSSSQGHHSGPDTSNQGPSPSPAVKRDDNQNRRLANDHLTTPVPAMPQTPMSSPLFVSPASRQQSSGRSYRSTQFRQHNDSENYHFSERQYQSVREGTEATEVFQRRPKTSKIDYVCEGLARLKRDWDRLDRKIKMCE